MKRKANRADSEEGRDMKKNLIPMMCFSSLNGAFPTINLKTVERSFDNRITVKMPAIGLGTYKFKKGSGEAKKATIDALRMGYRAIDTAFIYGGEKTEIEIGEALEIVLKEGNDDCIKRSDIFITSKQWRSYHGYDLTKECLNKSLQRLGVDYLDCYLVHWPGCAYNTMARSKERMSSSDDGAFVYAKEGHEIDNIVQLRSETWRAMEDAVLEGKCRAIGVSNFSIRHLEALKKTARIWPPAMNQIELHPYNPQTDLVNYCKKEGIIVQAYGSLGGQDSGKKTWRELGGKLTEREEILSIAERYGKTPVQILLKWASMQGYGVIPKSTNVEHLQENLEALKCDWQLDEDDLNIISKLDRSHDMKELTRLCWVRDPLKMLDFD